MIFCHEHHRENGSLTETNGDLKGIRTILELLNVKGRIKCCISLKLGIINNGGVISFLDYNSLQCAARKNAREVGV